MSSSITVRTGRPGDGAAVLALWDAAIAWLLERGQPGQWGAQPASARTRCREMVREWESGPGLRVAEIDGCPVGASVIGARPDYVPSVPKSETYLVFLISDRTRMGLGIGSELVRHAVNDARAVGSEVLRADCWAGAPALVRWYEQRGFTRAGGFTVNDGWRGQLLKMTI